MDCKRYVKFKIQREELVENRTQLKNGLRYSNMVFTLLFQVFQQNFSVNLS